MLADKLFALNSFQRQYEALLALSACASIQNLIWHTEKEELLNRIDWNNILSIASVLSHSERNEHLDSALRIAQTTLVEENTNNLQKAAATAILLSLTNKPAIQLAIQRELIPGDLIDDLPFAIKLQNAKLDFENSILIKDRVLPLNKFQSDVHRSYEINDAISISAPTSAGKSFILYSIVTEEIINGRKNIVYIVPTRALISQVQKDLQTWLTDYNLSNVSISTVPQDISHSDQSNILVFTQERLHWFLIENKNFSLDVIIIDEAHKIEDSYRGILLQQKLEEVIDTNPNMKIFFSSPFTSNPELFLENINPNTKSDTTNTEFISVNQNLIFTKQVLRKVDKWELELCMRNNYIQLEKDVKDSENLYIPLGQLELKYRPSSEIKKIAYIASAFSANQNGNILYSNGAAEAENIALILYDLLEEVSSTDNINNLTQLVKKTIHSNYRLASVLEKRIAFHYGNMPLIIREEIERLFKEGDIKYLICTSTLLEGVNLPAKSIFIRKPKRGISTPLNENDFWNLAGRAGRWGKEFSGDIVCIEPMKWKIKPNPTKRKQKIIRALDLIINKKKEFLEYIKNDSPREIAEKRQDLEFAFGYYYSKYLDRNLLPTNELNTELISLFDELSTRLTLPAYIIKRNPGISPIAQQALLDFFYVNIYKIENLIPVYPEDENAFEEYAALIGLIGQILSFYPSQLNRTRSILLINWMSGKPLSYIISKSLQSYRSNPKYAKKSIHTIIREVMDSIENFARFRFAKDSSCYIDILRYFLELHGRHDLIKDIPQLNLWLEFGVSQKTHLSLLSLGLSRNTVIELSRFITNPNMSVEETRAWLRNQELSKFEISPIIINDIQSKVILD